MSELPLSPSSTSALLDELHLLTRTNRIEWQQPMDEALVHAGFDYALTLRQWATLPWYGVLEVLRQDTRTSDILVNGPERPITIVQAGARFGSGVEAHESWIRFAQDQLLLRSGVLDARQLTERAQLLPWPKPLLIGTADRRLRFAVTERRATPDGPTIALRLLPTRWPTLPDLVRANLLPLGAANMLLEALRCGVTVLVAGGTGSGKTTLTAALLEAIGAEKRIVVIEEARELPSVPDGVAVEVGNSALGFAECVRFALRQKPDLIVVGEIRGAEALAMLQAAATGHPGIGTVHAPDVQAALKNTERMACEHPDVQPNIVRGLLTSSAVPLIVCHIGRYDGVRCVGAIDEVLPQAGGSQAGDRYVTHPLFAWNRETKTVVRRGTVQGEWGRGRL